MLTARAGNGYITPSAGNAEAGFTKRTFKIFMLTVLYARKKSRNSAEAFFQSVPKTHKRGVFLTAVIVVTRKGAETPKRDKRKLNKRKRQVDIALYEHRNKTAKERDRQDTYIKLVVSVTTVHKFTKQNITSD